jgi:hypothetical protein
MFNVSSTEKAFDTQETSLGLNPQAKKKAPLSTNLSFQAAILDQKNLGTRHATTNPKINFVPTSKLQKSIKSPTQLKDCRIFTSLQSLPNIKWHLQYVHDIALLLARPETGCGVIQ